MARRKQPAIWGRAAEKTKKEVKRRTSAELDALAEEFRAEQLATLHLCLMVWNPRDGSDHFIELWDRGRALYDMKPVEIRKLKEYKQYIREFHK